MKLRNSIAMNAMSLMGLASIVLYRLLLCREVLIGLILHKIAGLAVEMVADLGERRKAHAVHLAGFKQREIGFGNADGSCQHI